jgi:hypothetical protein
MDSQQIIEIIMTQHWDLKMCDCWVCRAGRELGYAPRETYLYLKLPHLIFADRSAYDPI